MTMARGPRPSARNVRQGLLAHSQKFAGGPAFVRRNRHLPFRSFTPGPSPFVNSTPDDSKEDLIRSSWE